MYEFGFIGCGHMGSELARVVAGTGVSMAISDQDQERITSLQKETGAAVLKPVEICKECKFIVLGVRPQSLPELADEIRPALTERKERFLLITMMAGKSIASVLEAMGFSAPVIRIMPNLPVKLGAGVIMYTSNAEVLSAEVEEFVKAFTPGGSLIPVDESLIDAGSVLSGCGPAFVYQFIEHFAKAGEKIGLSPELSLRLVCETAIGASKMVLSSDKSPAVLCSEVCSKGGTTEQGVMSLNRSDFAETVEDAVEASYSRTLELR